MACLHVGVGFVKWHHITVLARSLNYASQAAKTSGTWRFVVWSQQHGRKGSRIHPWYIRLEHQRHVGIPRLRAALGNWLLPPDLFLICWGIERCDASTYTTTCGGLQSDYFVYHSIMFSYVLLLSHNILRFWCDFQLNPANLVHIHRGLGAVSQVPGSALLSRQRLEKFTQVWLLFLGGAVRDWCWK